MRNLIIFGLLIILLLAAQFTSAKTVDEVIEKHLRARGGFNKLASLKSISMEGTQETVSGKAEIRIFKEQDKLSRTEIYGEAGNGYILITGMAVHAFLPHNLAIAGNPGLNDLAALQVETDIAGPLVDYVAKGHKTELLGKEMVEGTTCYKVRLTTNAGNEILYWIDTGTYLLHQSWSGSGRRQI